MTIATVERALGYPYRPVTTSLKLHDNGGQETWSAADEIALSQNGDYVAVIACGSNRAPEQITRKFNGYGLGSVHISPADLPGFDCVYSAHVTSYGAIPATLCPAPGVTAAVAVLWLDGPQLKRMHATESLGRNYAFEALSTPGLVTQNGLEIKTAYQYKSLRGIFSVHGDAIALSEIPAKNRSKPGWSQQQVLSFVHQDLAKDIDFEAFVVRLSDDRPYRDWVSAQLPQ